VVLIKSSRAQKVLAQPRYFSAEKKSGMRRYPGHENLWLEIEWDKNNVKNLSFFGDLKDYELVLLDSMASLLVGKPVSSLSQLSVRECEAFLRDRNSELALEGMTEKIETEFKSLFSWLTFYPLPIHGIEFTFSSEKGPFQGLSLVEKVRQIKAFLQSSDILTLYQHHPRPELIDVEGLTVYVEAPYETSEEKALFEELHLLGVAAFQEENLNFIPEA
jgi:hypothetical protein